LCVGDATTLVVLPDHAWISPSPPPALSPPPSPPAPPSPPSTPPAVFNIGGSGSSNLERETVNVLETNVENVGEWGGTCTCPDGEVRKHLD